MSEKVAVVQILQNNVVMVVPLITDACIGCSRTSCVQQGKPFTVKNSSHLPISKGDILKISAEKRFVSTQAFTALIVPALCAVAGYFLPTLFLPTARISEGLKTASVLICFILAVGMQLLLARLFPTANMAQIIEIVGRVETEVKAVKAANSSCELRV